MSGRIPQDFIDDLIQRADIVEVVGSRVQLTKAGREYKARCPFHAEKTPSFWVSPQKGFYHCFGCGAHGTALGFLMEYERLDFPTAVEELARQVGVEVPREDGERQNVEPLLRALDQAGRIYRQALRDHPPAVDYLKGRGLDGETAREFGIGYAPAAWDRLLGELGSTEEDRRHLLAAGLIIARDSGGFYDRFRDRIMFPIRDARGRVIAFGGRILGAGEPKYLNSPETALFHKGRELYGLFESRHAARKPVRMVVVEGYMDVVMLAAHGIRNVVGTLGTATTAEHLRRLFGIAPEVVFCFDGDRAGREAARRAMQVSLPLLRDGRQVRFLLLPEGEDPDTLVRKEGAEAFEARLAASLPLSTFMLDDLAEGLDLDTPDAKAVLHARARPLLAQLGDEVYRALIAAELDRRVGLPARPVPAPAEPSRPPVRPAGRRQPPGARGDGRGSLARQAISLLLHFPSVAAKVALPPDLEAAGQRGLDLLAEIHAIAAARPDLRPAALLERFRDRPERVHLDQLLTVEPLVDEDGAAAEFADCLARIQAVAVQQKLSALLRKAGQESLSPAEREELEVLRQAVASQGAGGR